MTQSGHKCFAETFHHESNPDLDFCFRDQGKDLELCRNIARVIRRGFTPRRHFQRLVGDLVSEYLFFGLVEFKNSHKQLTFVGQWRCCLELTGFPSRRILS
jgi:hypothetical protein